MISKKRGRVNFGTAMHIEYHSKGPRYLVKCEYFNRKTGHCKRHGFLVWDYGSEVCERCEFNQDLNSDETNVDNGKEKKKKRKKQKNNNYENNERIITDRNTRTNTVLEIANTYCELCGNKQKNLNIYMIDLNKLEKDSVFNIVALCNACVTKVDSNNEKYREMLKQIALERDYE